MNNYLFLKYSESILRRYVFIFFTVIAFLLLFLTKSFPEENIFTINEILVKGEIDLKFSQNNYISFAIIFTIVITQNDSFCAKIYI